MDRLELLSDLITEVKEDYEAETVHIPHNALMGILERQGFSYSWDKFIESGEDPLLLPTLQPVPSGRFSPKMLIVARPI